MQEAAAQEYFGIVDDQHSVEAAVRDLPPSLCKIKGDLLLIEMAVNEVCECVRICLHVSRCVCPTGYFVMRKSIPVFMHTMPDNFVTVMLLL